MKTIIIPAYNESQSIGEVIRKSIGIFPDLDVLVINDGSTDDTVRIAMEAGATAISHPYNIGNGAAIKTGLRVAKGPIIITMDADGQHDPADIPRLLEHVDRYDMVVGARGRGPGARGIANMVYNLLASYVTGRKIEDLTSGFRAIRADVAKKFIYLLPNGFSYPTTITLALMKSGHSVKYVPIKARPRVGKSKIRPIRDGIKFFSIIIKITTLFSPFKIFLPVSGFFFIGGLIYYWYAYVTGTRFPNLPTFMIISGVIIFMMGLIAEQIAALRLDRSEE
jgi:glycosyltransferase involved in cell wall biosynthesis